jgi:MoxR-like ATPase
VFADRNRVEREETFEISSAARDRFMMEVTIESPSEDADRRALVFDPRFHDTDALLAQLPQAILPFAELGDVAAAIQKNIQASPALQDYALNLWRATTAPSDFGIRLDEVEVSEASANDVMLAGASPRGMSLMLRAARVHAWLQERTHVTPEDLRAVFFETMAHRLCLQPVYEMRRPEIVAALMRGVMERVAAP